MTKNTQVEVKDRPTDRKRSRSDARDSEKNPPQAPRTSRSASAVSSSLLYEPPSDVIPVAPLRRRVNPASLAHRLGPELVAELESLIKPGCTEMPSFAARQAVQKRYMVDRRHIYDWYHTKGLRVSSKSEKRSAVMHIEQEETRSLRPRFQKKLRSVPDGAQVEVASGFSDSTSSTPVSTPVASCTPSDLSASNPPLHYDYSGMHLLPFPIHCFFESPSDPALHTSIQAQGSKPLYTEDLEPSGRRVHNWSAPSHLDRTTHWVAENQNQGRRFHYESNNSLPFLQHEHYFDENLNPFLPVTQEQSLPKIQREACYQYLSEAVGPAHGVQESVGTYRAYMTQQVSTYYDRILPDQRDSGHQVHSNQRMNPVPVPVPATPTGLPVSTSVIPPSTLYSGSIARPVTYQTLHRCASESLQTPQGKPSTPNLEYSNWLLHNSQIQQFAATASAPLTPTVSSSVFSTPSNANSSINWLWNTSQNTSAGDSSGISLEISDILESPVLRTRQNTRNDVGSPCSIAATSLAKISELMDQIPTAPPSSLVNSPTLTEARNPIVDGFNDEMMLLAEPFDPTIRRAASFSMSLRAVKTVDNAMAAYE
ncbi:unnamed protein product [Somion occarium]|uniref:Clr5 domain-containing protein n=1 Tax=Somion occarium TaxID=3059160 RepID=A0ABP1CI01_9APHY